MKACLLCAGLLLIGSAGPAIAQILIANDDTFSVPFGEPLIIEAFGILDNDLLNDESAGESGATATLIVDVNHGSLTLNSDGSFSYSPGVSFDGSDEFVYRAEFDTASAEATVTLSACTGGPDVFTCWSETAWLAKLAESGYLTFQEGFEDDAVWGTVRTPASLPWVSSQGILWQSNHTGLPSLNNISTTSGPPRTGLWAIFDPNHGFATGTPFQCDVDNPPEHCLYYDGFTGVREPGLAPLHGVGGFIDGIVGGRVAILLDDGLPIGGGRVGNAHQFFGVVDTRPAGFNRFEFRELDGKIGQALYIFGDDFTMATTEQPTAVLDFSAPQVFFSLATENPSRGSTELSYSLPSQAGVRLAVYDLRGRLVRELVDTVSGPGVHLITWDGRDRHGIPVSAGVYFGQLVTQSGGVTRALKQKIVVLH